MRKPACGSHGDEIAGDLYGKIGGVTTFLDLSSGTSTQFDGDLLSRKSQFSMGECPIFPYFSWFNQFSWLNPPLSNPRPHLGACASKESLAFKHLQMEAGSSGSKLEQWKRPRGALKKQTL